MVCLCKNEFSRSAKTKKQLLTRVWPATGRNSLLFYYCWAGGGGEVRTQVAPSTGGGTGGLFLPYPKPFLRPAHIPSYSRHRARKEARTNSHDSNATRGWPFNPPNRVRVFGRLLLKCAHVQLRCPIVEFSGPVLWSWAIADSICRAELGPLGASHSSAS
ncbi:hypothetical protein BX600DRAFT_315596 [Xylariales sp. PMI_506]|nr:hypothetical protein BX600DRAFT_315596 [Xylariales sp. PMI_506]